jgi:hypothetical protein
MVHRGKLSAITAGSLLVLYLRGGGRLATLMFGGELRLRWTSRYSARPAVVADAGDVNVVDHSLVINVHVRDVDVIDRAIVVEIITSPVSAIISRTGVTESVVDAAVKSYDGPPVACMPDV